jgi:hypothetical protein
MSVLPLPHSTFTHRSNLTIMSILAQPGPKRPALPVDIILQILSHHSRWIQSAQFTLGSPLQVTNTVGAKVLICTPPLTPQSIRLLRKVVFTFTARDQGWSSYNSDHGTYENSWTWFDAAVRKRRTRPPIVDDHNELGDGEDNPDDEADFNQELASRANVERIKRQHLQANVHAGRLVKPYRVELEAKQGILQDLEEGDEIALLACASFPGWVNHVEGAGIELWEVDGLGKW